MHLWTNSIRLFIISYYTITSTKAGQIIIPQVFTCDSLVQIVTNYGSRNVNVPTYIPETNAQYQNKPLGTYMTWTTTGLNLWMPDWVTSHNFALKTSYFKIQSKRCSSKIVFILILNGNFLETATAIGNSGFGNSSAVPFFVFVKTIYDEVARGFTLSLENQLAFEPIRPFHPPIIFYSDSWSIQLVFCYFCPGRLAKLFPINTYLIENSRILASLKQQWLLQSSIRWFTTVYCVWVGNSGSKVLLGCISWT